MTKYDRDVWLIFGGTVLFVAVMITGLLGFKVMVSAWNCSRTAGAMSVEWKYGIGYGCMVQTRSGRYVPLNAIRDVDL
jgi:hypothetical protein